MDILLQHRVDRLEAMVLAIIGLVGQGPFVKADPTTVKVQEDLWTAMIEIAAEMAAEKRTPSV